MKDLEKDNYNYCVDMASFYNKKGNKELGFASSRIITRIINALLVWDMVEL